MQEHEFAIYFQNLQNIKSGSFILSDVDIIHRILVVLRFKEGDKLILFNNIINITCSISKILNKKTLELLVITNQINSELFTNKILPEITWGLPILKRDNFEDAIYSLTELGIKYIQPILTAKSANWFGKEKDLIRCKKIVISACEQSKNFDIPIILPILKMQDWLNNISNSDKNKIFFDANGFQANIILKNLDKNLNIICCSGPEGDLDNAEKDSLIKANFKFCKLTPTILRAQQAIVVGAGLIRSII